MARVKEMDINKVRTLIAYDPDTGMFTWLPRGNPQWDGKWAGKKAGTVNGPGYCVFELENRPFLAHRVAWAISHGRWPANQIDHIDGDRANNRLSNLREATVRENHQNRSRHTSNTSGYLGVYWHAPTKKWQAKIMVNGNTHHLGVFDCPAKAHAAYLVAKRQLHVFNPVLRSEQVTL
jgi:hypothetical protein